MYRALYRKWRPQRFADVVGQTAIVTALQNQISAGRIGHAYLFTGTRGTGKTTCAKIFAKAVNCLDTSSPDPCGECEICKGIDSGSVMDIIEMDAASNNGVDDIRDLRDEVAYLPSVCKYKVYIIDEVHMLSTAAFNALLKILEEPWEKTVFLLVSEAPDRLLQTILSRTQEVAVPRISTEVLEAVAARHGQSDPARLHNLARLAGGDYLTLQRLLAGEDDELTRDCFGLFCSLMRLSYNDKHLELVSWAEEVAHLSREQQRAFLRHAARLLRESYMLHAGLADISYLWGAEADFCGKFAPFIGNENVEFLLDEIERAMRQITQNGNPTIVFTHFALSVSKQIRRK